MAEFSLNPIFIPNQERYEIKDFDSIKEVIRSEVLKYKNLVVTEDAISLAKSDRANLNKKKKLINQTKISIVSNATKLFEDQCKELIGIIDEAVQNIDSQVKEYENQKKNEKKELIYETYKELVDNSGLSLDSLWDERWLNASYTMLQIDNDIIGIIENYQTDYATLKSIATNDGELKLANEVLKETLSLSKAIAKLNEVRKIASEVNGDNITNNSNIKENNVSTDKNDLLDRRYVGFIVHINKHQAELLGNFMNENGIDFEQISNETLKEIMK